MVEKQEKRSKGKLNGNVSSIIFWGILVLQILMTLYFFVSKQDVTGYVAETADIELGARSKIVDEYMGPLYPFLVRGAVSLQAKLGIPYYLFVYCLQGSFFILALCYMVKALQKGISRYLTLPVICTLPMVLRCLLQVTPFLLRCAFGMLIVGSAVRILKRDGKLRYSRVILLAGYFLASMNVPDDAYLWGIIILILIVVSCRQKSKGYMFVMAALGICLMLCTVMVQKEIEISGGYGRVQRSIASTVFQNCMWEKGEEKDAFLQRTFPEEYSMEEWPEWAGQEELQHSYGAKIDYVLGPSRANRFYIQASGALIKQYGISVILDYFGWMLEKILRTIVSNWTILLLLLLLHFSCRDTQEKKTAVWFFGGILTELFLITFTRGPWWDERACLLGLILLSLVCMRRDWSREENEIRRLGLSLKRRFTPKGKRFFCVTITALALVCMVTGLFYWKNLKTQKKELSGRVLCLGDSIWGLEKGENGIAAFLEEETNLLVENYAVPGTSVGKRPGQEFDGESLESIMEALGPDHEQENVTEITRQIVEHLNIETADMVVLAYGLNDYYSGLGTEVYEYGLEHAIQVIQGKKPTVKICIIGPTQCLFYQNGVVVADGSDRDFGGGVLDEYNLAAERVAERNQVMYINMQEELSVSRYNDAQMLIDGTHLTEYGRKKYAEVIIRHLVER